MAESTAVVLLFDDEQLGAHLREALQEHGARIVHEGGLGDLGRDLWTRVAADVVVINLDDGADEVMDRLEASLEGDHPRVVFNEAESSRALDGWARARWARHLAAKVLAQTDVDPPRPPAPAAAEAGQAADGTAPAAEFSSAPEDPTLVASHEAQVAAESESLEAELEALLSGEEVPASSASGEPDDHAVADPADAADMAGTEALDDFELDELALGELDHPPLYDGDFLDLGEQPPAVADAATTERGGHGEDEANELLDELLAMPDQEPPPAPVDTAKPAKDAESLFRLTDDWSLVDDSEPSPPAAPAPTPASAFGIEKLSAHEFLAPESEGEAGDEEPLMTLELVSMEEAVAPKSFDPHTSNEMILEELTGGLSRVVMLGATTAGSESVAAFLGQLPEGMRATIVHVQHQGGRPVEDLVRALSANSPFSVRQAESGQQARVGELLVVPADHHLRMTRDGRMELKPSQDMPAASPSIDGTFSALANVFGVDALAILFAGQANDAVAGCQAVHDRGGRIWVEDAPGEHFADMVSGVLAEHLADFSGTPAELAARLIEEYR